MAYTGHLDMYSAPSMLISPSNPGSSRSLAMLLWRQETLFTAYGRAWGIPDLPFWNVTGFFSKKLASVLR